MTSGQKDRYWKIERQGKFYVVNILQEGKYVPLMIFDSLPLFHQWARTVGDQCSSYAQLAEEIEKVYKSVFTEPAGQVWDYVNRLETIDEIGRRNNP